MMRAGILGALMGAAVGLSIVAAYVEFAEAHLKAELGTCYLEAAGWIREGAEAVAAIMGKP